MKLCTRHFLDNYLSAISELCDRFFATHKPADQRFQALLSETIIACFQLPARKVPKHTKALWILEKVFYELSKGTFAVPPFSLCAFIESHNLNKLEVQKLLTSVLYGFYYREIPCSDAYIRCNIEPLLLQILAVIISSNKLRKILVKKSLDKHAHLIGFLFKHYREGSYTILQALKEIFSKKQYLPKDEAHFAMMIDLIQGLSTKQYELKAYLKQLRTIPINEVFLAQTLTALKSHTRQTIKAIFKLFNNLLPLIIDAPIKVSAALDALKNPSTQLHDNQEALQQQQALKNHFQSYFDAQYTLQDFVTLISIFGLSGQQPILKITGKQLLAPSLLDKLKLLHEVFSDPLAIVRLAPTEAAACMSLIFTLISHLETLRQHPERFKRGLANLTPAIATCGKLLDKQAALESILEGMSALISFSNAKLNDSLSLRNFPVFIYDQSTAPLFHKNRRYIDRLNQQYAASIIHLSYSETMAVAEKINITGLINPSERTQMGYGGARNCIFLLTPLLKHLFANDIKTIPDVLKIDEHVLREKFYKIVLQSHPENTIFMVDDDMQIPLANIFTHALFAEHYQSKYLCAQAFCYGRTTKYANKFRTLEELFEHPWSIFDSAQWTDIPFVLGMGEYIGKPKIGLNLPLGQEESHLQIKCMDNPLGQASIHLAGTRYPQTPIPSHFYVGLEAYLQKNIPYVLGISLSMDLIDPSNTDHRAILPWNAPAIANNFGCLKDVLEFIALQKNQQDLQARFWKNVRDLFDATVGPSIPLRQYLDYLIYSDFNSALKKLINTHRRDGIEQRSLNNIVHLYQFYQQDAKLMCVFGCELIKRMPFQPDHQIKSIINNTKQLIEKQQAVRLIDYPTTYNFFLLCLNVGAGEFSTLIKQLLPASN